MSWQLLLTIGIFTASITTILEKILIDKGKNDVVAYSIVFQFISGILIGIYAIFRGFEIPNIPLSMVDNLIFMFFIFAFGVVFVFKALKYTEASTESVLMSSRSLWTIIFAIIFLNEKFSLSQVAGSILIIFSVGLISMNSFKFKLGKGEIYTLLAAICFGVGFVNDAILLKDWNVPTYLCISFIGTGLAIALIHPKSFRNMKNFVRQGSLNRIIVISLIYSVSVIAVYQAYTLGKNAAQLAGLYEMAVILTVVLATIFLKERSNLPKKLIAAVVSVVGVFLLG
jgi:drug/metabolite transporter (DMT)-like permease